MASITINLNKNIQTQFNDSTFPEIEMIFKETDFVGRRNEQGYLVLPKEYDDGYDYDKDYNPCYDDNDDLN